jgi:Uma2 family endonuclease
VNPASKGQTMILPEVRVITVDEFEDVLREPENRDRNLELINGSIVEKAMPTEEHALTVNLWLYYLTHWALEKGVGLPGPEHRFRVPGDKHNTRQPDIAMILETESPITVQGATQRPPDVIVEVKSPDDSIREMRERAAWYIANGVKLVFLHFPRQHFIEAHRPDADVDIFTFTETVEGYDVLPGFSVLVEKLFPRKRGG